MLDFKQQEQWEFYFKNQTEVQNQKQSKFGLALVASFVFAKF